MRAALLLATCLVLAFPDELLGCSCVVVSRPGEPLLENGRPAPTLRALEQYDSIFLGRVTASSPLPAEMPDDALYLRSGSVTEFSVERFWGKRVVGPVVAVLSPAPGGACGYSFHAGQTYLVFARIHRGTGQVSPSRQAVDALITDVCTLTTPRSVAHDLLSVVQRLLGPGRPPVE